MNSHPWNIDLFGGFRIERDGNTISRFRSRSAAALLAYLALRHPVPQARDDLCELLWPEEHPDPARNRLRVELASLRRQLEPAGDGPAVFLADRSTIGLQATGVHVDVVQFRDALARAGRAGPSGEQIESLVAANELCRGELLSGWYEEWVEPERRWLLEERMGALARLVRLLAREGQAERAIHYARMAARADPHREDPRRDLLQLLMASGQLTSALGEYHAYERRVRQELDADPSVGLMRLKEKIVQKLGRDVEEAPALTPQPKGACARSAPLPRTGEGGPSVSCTSSASHERRGRAQSRLPKPVTRCFGREAAVQEITESLRCADSPGRLVTLTGPGGVGKTRLALEIGEAYSRSGAGPAQFVSLAGVQHPAHIPAAFAAALGVEDQAEPDALAAVADRCEAGPDGRLLLVLDNLEHLLPEGEEAVRRLLELAPTLHILATSRRIVGLDDEREVAVSPLALPGKQAAHGACGLESFPSIQLFLDRAQAIRPDFALTDQNAAVIASLCRRLDGLPLALELAAARVRTLTPAEMVAALDQGEDLLVNRRAEKDARQRSLRATVEWSYRLLSPPLRRTFTRLAVFRGGWTRSAARAVCPDTDVVEQLEELQSESLVLSEEDEWGMRFRMLETLRTYAEEQLPQEERLEAQRLHARSYLEFVETVGCWLEDPARPERAARLEAERDNVLAAADWLRDHEPGSGEELRLTAGLLWFWLRAGRLPEGQARLKAAIEASRGRPELAKLRGFALHALSQVYCYLDAFEPARSCSEQARSLLQEVGDEQGVTGVGMGLGFALHGLGRFEEAQPLLEGGLALARTVRNSWMEGCALNLLGFGACFQGRYDEARRLLEESLIAFYDHDREDVWALHSLLGLARVAWLEQDLEAARSYYHTCAEGFLCRRDRRGVVYCLEGLGRIATAEGRVAHATTLLGAAVALRETSGMSRDTPDTKEFQVSLAATRSALPTVEWAQAWHAGRALRPEEAVTFALQV